MQEQEQTNTKNQRVRCVRIENNGGKETSDTRDRLMKLATEKGIKEDQIEFSISCDFCRNDIPTDETSRCNFTCRDGDCCASYDLCLRCQTEYPYYTTECPDGFQGGCNVNEYYNSPSYSKKDVDEDDEIFVPLVEKPLPDQYTVCGKTMNVVAPTKTKDEKDMQFFLDFLETTGFLKVGGLFYTEGPELSHNFLADMWLYFRSTDHNCIQKYGEPSKSGSQTIYNPGSWKLMKMYENLKPIFDRFIEFDNEQFSGKAIGIVFVYPNGDEFYIRRLYGEELQLRKPNIFLTQKFPFSTIKEWDSRWEDPNKTNAYSKELPKHAGKTDQSKSQYITIGYLLHAKKLQNK